MTAASVQPSGTNGAPHSDTTETRQEPGQGDCYVPSTAWFTLEDA